MHIGDILPVARFARDNDIDIREVTENVIDGKDDFEVDGYRFIRESMVDEVMLEELSSDDYMLGCFNASFLAGVLGIDQEVIEIMQKSEAFEAVGKLVKSLDKMEELQEEYALEDGYGPQRHETARRTRQRFIRSFASTRLDICEMIGYNRSTPRRSL